MGTQRQDWTWWEKEVAPLRGNQDQGPLPARVRYLPLLLEHLSRDTLPRHPSQAADLWAPDLQLSLASLQRSRES